MGHFEWYRDPPSALVLDEEFSIEKPLVYHLFGTFSTTKSLVLSEDDYFAWLRSWMKQVDKGVGIPDCIKPPLMDNSLVFLGYGFDDWEFRMIFQAIKGFEGTGQPFSRHVGVQFEPGALRIEPEAAQEYLEDYLGADHLDVYWGSCGEFLEELEETRPVMNYPSSSPSPPPSRSPSRSSSAGATTSELEPSIKRTNPYVGPRPFCKGELFFGREREATSVVNSLLSGRVMLLHSPSGAGKTSLIQISIVPSFERRDFLTCAGSEIRTDTDPEFTALCVNLPPPEGVPNRYVFSVVNGLIGHFTDHERACGMTVGDAVEEFAQHHNSKQRQLLVLDQLEEVLTLNPGDVEGQIVFFEQLGEALNDSRRWALLAIREDYMGALDRFRQYLPGQLRATFRLDLLDIGAALRAVQKPAQASGGEFYDDAAQMLVNDLRLVYSGYGEEDTPTVKSPYVEPALLQVVCYDVFRKLSKDQGSNFDAITVENIENYKPFDKSISKYYRTVIREAAKEAATGDAANEAVVRDAAKENRGIEQVLRDWVGHDLIGQQRLRRQTRQKPPVPKPEAALHVMQGMYLIRDDPRPGGRPCGNCRMTCSSGQYWKPTGRGG
jgi:SIR2-like domain